MARWKFRTVGMTATHAPIIKRATGRMSTGASLFLLADANRADSNGDSTTGTPRMYLYKTLNDRSEIDFAGSLTLTSAAGALTSTTAAVASMAVDANNNVHLAFQDRTDNSLKHMFIPWTGSAWGAVTVQTVAAGTAVTNRYRAIDIDVTSGGAFANPIIVVLEAKATSGQGAWFRHYIRNADGTTWRKAVELNLSNTAFIRSGSEDVSVSWNAAGISSNVGQYVAYFTDIWTTSDGGDDIREYQYNVSTGTDGSATQLGYWSQTLNQNIASGQRRTWLFKHSSDKWVMAQAVGTSVPFFSGTKLTHNDFTTLVQNKVLVDKTSKALSQGLQIHRDVNPMNAVTADYADERLQFVFVSPGIVRNRALRSVVMRWDDPADLSTAYKDSISRIYDRDSAATSENTGVIGVYGGANSRTASGDNHYSILALYGVSGSTVSTTDGQFEREYVYVTEDTLAAPVILAPRNVNVGVDTPSVYISARHGNKYSNVLGKLELEIDDNAGFTSPADVIEVDSRFQTFSSFTTADQPTRFYNTVIPVSAGLSSGTWYMRARILDDMGGAGEWSTTASFTISHPPVPLPLSPAENTIQLYGTGDVNFRWQFTDPSDDDSQSAYQLVVIRTDTGAIVTDTGKVTSSDDNVTLNFVVGLKDIPLQWTVTLWDADDVQGPASAPIIFQIADAPTVTLDMPVNASTIATALPTFQWTFSAGGGRTQRAFRVIVYPTANPDAVVADSGWKFSDASSYQFPTQILINAVNYTAEIHVQDSASLTATDSNTFDTDWVEPVLADLTVTTDDFKATLTWTDANLDPDFVRWFVYRRYMKTATVDLDVDDTANTWVLIGETADNSALVTFNDYTAPLGKSCDYVVVQLVDRFGSLVESEITSFETATLTGDRYFIVPEVPIGAIASFEASNVVADSFAPETERETLHVVGRGRQVQIGDDLGYSGSLSIQLRNPATARRDREFIEAIASSDTGNVYLKSPFGDVLYVSFGDPSFNRRPGSGTSDLGDLSVSYVEVFGDEPITRTV